MKSTITVLSCVVGGATAINQYLADYRDCFSFGYEADLFRGVGGIYEMYHMWEANDTHLIHNILTEFVSAVNRISHILSIFEKDHSIALVSTEHRISAEKFKELSDDFLHKIISDDFFWKSRLFRWQAIGEYNKNIKILPYNSNHLKYKIGNFFIRMAGYITGIPQKAEIDCSIPERGFIKREISTNDFVLIAKQYLSDVFDSFSNKDVFVPLYLLTSQRTSSFEEQSVFFDNLKMIYLIRDPRDTFIGWLGRNWITEEETNVFCNWYRYFSVDYPHNHKKILDIRFEDFVLNHGETSMKILNLAGISEDSKVDNPRYNVEDSKKTSEDGNRTLTKKSWIK